MAIQMKRIDVRNGMALDRTELDALETARVRAQARVNPVRQPNGNLVLVCEESGGGNKDLGHYVGFLPLAGTAFISSRKLVCLGENSTHRRIVASMFVRFEVFRYKENFVHALITLHRTDRPIGNAPGQVTRQTLFRGKFGEIEKSGIATFPADDGGVDLRVPSFLADGFQAALVGTRCRGCQHSGHFESVGNVKLPDSVMSALHISILGVRPATVKAAAVVVPAVATKAKATAAA